MKKKKTFKQVYKGSVKQSLKQFLGYLIAFGLIGLVFYFFWNVIIFIQKLWS